MRIILLFLVALTLGGCVGSLDYGYGRSYDSSLYGYASGTSGYARPPWCPYGNWDVARGYCMDEFERRQRHSYAITHTTRTSGYPEGYGYWEQRRSRDSYRYDEYDRRGPQGFSADQQRGRYTSPRYDRNDGDRGPSTDRRRNDYRYGQRPSTGASGREYDRRHRTRAERQRPDRAENRPSRDTRRRSRDRRDRARERRHD